MKTIVFDSKPYDREYLQSAVGSSQVDWNFQESRLTPETAKIADGSQAVCIFVNDLADRPTLQSLAKQGVRLVALRCAGFNNVDLVAAKELGLSIVRVPAYSPHAVAEHTVGLLMTLNRKIHRAYNRVRELNFSINGLVGFDIFGKTIGIIGTGRIGQITAQIFRGFGANVIAYDPFPNSTWANTNGVRYTSLDDLFSQSDVLSLHLPLTPETKHLINSTTLARTKRGVYLVNTSRGKLIETTALIAAIKTGQVGGVALDVYEEEEGVFFHDLSGIVPQDQELSQLLIFPNVLITSHQAFLTQEALSEIARVTVENLLRFHRQEAFLEGTSL